MTQGHIKNLRAHLKTHSIDLAIPLPYQLWIGVYIFRLLASPQPYQVDVMIPVYVSEDFEAHGGPVTCQVHEAGE